MIQKTLALSAVALLLVGSAFAAPDKSKGKKAPAGKQIVVNTCPMMGGDSSSAAGGSEVVGKYKVNFCCGGCKPEFDKLSKADKEKKVAEAVKKSSGKKA